jgi:hypothetical protein
MPSWPRYVSGSAYEVRVGDFEDALEVAAREGLQSVLEDLDLVAGNKQTLCGMSRHRPQYPLIMCVDPRHVRDEGSKAGVKYDGTDPQDGRQDS